MAPDVVEMLIAQVQAQFAILREIEAKVDKVMLNCAERWGCPPQGHSESTTTTTTNSTQLSFGTELMRGCIKVCVYAAVGFIFGLAAYTLYINSEAFLTMKEGVKLMKR